MHHGLTRCAGVFGEKIAPPQESIGAHVEAGDFVLAGDGFDEGAGVVRVGPAETVDVVVPHGEPASQLGAEQR